MGRNQRRRAAKRKETKKRWPNQRLLKLDNRWAPEGRYWVGKRTFALEDIQAAGGDLFEVG